jgi:ABC-type transport system involved in multi-copper enzyme maturation permease subunit
MGLSLQGYRPWEGRLRGATVSVWPVARVALMMIFRQKLFWLLYALALLNFLLFFCGIYLFSQIDLNALTGQGASAQQYKFWEDFKKTLQDNLSLAGNANTYRNFFWFQGYFVMAVLALAGTTIIGNDYRHGSLPFYLSKPISRWHYLFGKFLAIGVFVNMLTTLPALLLFFECFLLMDGYLSEHLDLLPGIVGYGMVITVTLSVLVVALAAWLRKVTPLIMVWVVLLMFCRIMSNILIDGWRLNRHWRLIDLWNDMYLVGSWMLNTSAELSGRRRGGVVFSREQPDVFSACVVLVTVVVLCLIYLQYRIRAIEIVR